MINANQGIHRDWDKYVSACVFAYNTSIHPATGYTPFMLMFGREAKLGSEGMLIGQRGEGSTYTTYVQEALERRRQAYENITKRVNKKAQVNINSDNIDVSINSSVFKLGDTVYVYRYIKSDKAAGISKKLASPWEGPYTIIEIFNAVS